MLAAAKSLAKQKKSPWHPVAAAPNSFVCPQLMHTASRALPSFIRTVLDVLAAPILRLHTDHFGEWVRDIPWAKYLRDADGKEQCHTIPPPQKQYARRAWGERMVWYDKQVDRRFTHVVHPPGVA